MRNFKSSLGSSSLNGEDSTQLNLGNISSNSQTVPDNSLQNERAQQTKYIIHRRLKFYFMDPLQKWKIRRHFPWKLALQLIKIIVVTFHIALFATNRFKHVVYFEHTQISFRHLFLKNWDSSREVIAYPPSNGIFAIYGIDEFYASLNYAIDRYFHLEENAIGSYDFPYENKSDVFVELCIYSYAVGKIWAFNYTYEFDSQTRYNCSRFYRWNSTQLTPSNLPFNFDSLIRVELKLQLNTVHLKIMEPLVSPDCYVFDIKITYDNGEHSGNFIIDLDTQNTQHQCHGQVHHKSTESKYQVVMLNLSVLAICALSLFLCIRALIRAHRLKKDCVSFFKTFYNHDLKKCDKVEFLNLWYITILVNDILLILGTILKLELERKLTTNQSIFVYDICGILLGCGCLLVWIGILRYLKFFPQYNVLLLTIKGALPNVFRYLVCGIFLYMGFLICGWVVFSPYHGKFTSISSSSECLYALINGDDMFATFTITSTKSQVVWWFSRIYLYTFNSLFIYVVINLFISVILDTYESIKEFWMKGNLSRSFLMQFINQNEECKYFHDTNNSSTSAAASPSTENAPDNFICSASYYDESDPLWKKCISCCFHKRFHTEDETLRHILEDVET